MTSPRIIIVDYGLGNLFNVSKAFAYQGIPAKISDDPTSIANADALVLPGVGAFKDGMEGLIQRGFAEPIMEFAAKDKPMLGICLGMEMFMQESFEMGHHQGLGLIPGSVRSFRQNGNQTIRVPHIGWNRIRLTNPADPLLKDVPNESMFYFVHSYFVQPKDPVYLAAETIYEGIPFCSVVSKGRIYGCQFHPEKSGSQGLALLSAFARLI